MSARPGARPRTRRALGALSGILLLSGVAAADGADEPRIAFALHGRPVASLALAALERDHAAQRVRVHEPYESGEVEFLAFDFAEILDGVYGRAWRAGEELLFTCRDGYQPSVPVARFARHRAWLAFARVDSGFSIAKRESGQLRSVPLAPFYLIWENLDDLRVRREGDYGWPYQLVGVDVIRTRERFPRMAPPEGSPAPVRAGFEAFRVHCSRCHAVNGEGGSIGPELNPPQSPVEVRSRDWLRRWIDDPARIAPNARMERLDPGLPDRARVIDEILAYLQAMADARRAASPPEAGRGG